MLPKGLLVDRDLPKDDLLHDRVLSILPEMEIPKVIRGIYFLIRKGRVVYVGQSVNLIPRIAEHWARKRKHFDSVKYWELPTQNLNVVEAELIWRLNPEYNGEKTKIGPSKKYQSINRHVLTQTVSARGPA